jgi:SAM-dependent methyltransferase
MDPWDCLSYLDDAPICDFIRYFFRVRYKGLITSETRSTVGYENTEDYAEAVLTSLRTDSHHTRDLFFAPLPLQDIHKRFRARNGERKFLFEAKAILPFMDELPKDSLTADLGAGDNSFLRTLKRVSGRTDLDFMGTDITEEPGTEKKEVRFVLQESEYDTGIPARAAAMVIMKASAHHILDPARMFTEVRRILDDRGLLVLIEESSDREPPQPVDRLAGMSDHAMNERFYDLSRDRRLSVMKFLDFYGVRIYRGWNNMPLPLRIHDADGWAHEIEPFGLQLVSKVNMGFAGAAYTSCLQRCNLVLCFRRA